MESEKEVWYTTDPMVIGKLIADKWQYFRFILLQVPDLKESE